ncbi:zinc finger protein 568-like [Anopheles cruzii]|uniref:zinc finger protein 568-like n=1 Tax=Anopheles cruzii TaxID=68878 RepID=UPI0022EC1E2C|nr:zinc finger protein 568-like [Anopheles cruzii]
MESVICLLCLKHKERLKVSSTVFETNVINTIALHFWFTKKVAQKHFVCNDCWKQVDEFDKFYKKVVLEHQRSFIENCPESPDGIHAEESEYYVSWDDESDTEQIDEKIGRIFEGIQQHHQKKIQIDDSVKKDDKDVDDKQIKTYDAARKSNRLKECASADAIDALDEGQSYSEYSFGLSGSEDEASDTESGESLDTHNKILGKHCETPALTPVPESTPYKCKSCDTFFVKEYQLTAHEQFCKRYKCIDCGLVFFDLKQLISHRKQHIRTKRGSPEQGGQAHQCTECSKSFPTEEAVDRHIAFVHYPEKFYICDVCAKSFKKKSDYNIHKRLVHLKQYISVECEICKKWLKDVTYLTTHIRKCHKTKTFACDTCGKVFATSWSLKHHIRSAHMTKETFLCSICGKNLASKNSLKEHCATHTSDYLYTCPYCPKKFNSSANRFVHKKKIHNLEWQKDREQHQNRNKPDHIVRRSGTETMETL